MTAFQLNKALEVKLISGVIIQSFDVPSGVYQEVLNAAVSEAFNEKSSRTIHALLT